MGTYRGVARFGGELLLFGLKDGGEWIMHAKSGYTAYRVPVEKATKYYEQMQQAGHQETDIARNFQRCVHRDIFRARVPLTRLFCFLRRHFRIEAMLGVTHQCDIRNKLVEGVPNLAECFPKDSGDALACGAESEVTDGAPIVHLVDWYAPGQERCFAHGEGLAPELKRVESSFGGVRVFPQAGLCESWRKVMKIWGECTVGTLSSLRNSSNI